MEAKAQVEQCRELGTHSDLAFCGASDAADELEQGGLARPIWTDDAEAPASLDLKVHVLERPVLPVVGAAAEEFEHAPAVAFVDVEALTHASGRDHP